MWWVAISILPFHLHTHAHTLSLSASWPLSGWPSVIPKSQHHLPSCERSQVLKIRFSQTPSQPVQRHRLPFWAWARGSVMLFPSPDKASHRGTAFDTYEKQSWHEPLLWEHAARCFFSLTAALIRKTVCLSARHWVITHTYKIFLSTCGQRFPTPHLQMHV